jgi:serine/threonine protein phosphatase 1
VPISAGAGLRFLMARPRLAFETWPAAVYAIGDVHGCLAQLLALERQILADGRRIPGEKWIVNLGDYIDRGPNSAGVVAHLLEPMPRDWKRFCLVGNHEQMLLDFLAEPWPNAYWLDEGGIETLRSYGIEATPDLLDDGAAAEAIPPQHLELLRRLPVTLSLPGWLFVHAGIRPGMPLAEQREEDLIFIRSPFLEATNLGGQRVVHGHTPGREPMVTPTRIGIDTHCFWSGRLTSVRVLPSGETKFFTAQG